jgi:hypothetical protein
MQQIEASFSLRARELRSRNGIEDVDVGPSCSCLTLIYAGISHSKPSAIIVLANSKHSNDSRPQCFGGAKNTFVTYELI